MRSDTVRPARTTFCAGCSVSTAAIVATSMPIMEKITTGTAVNIAAVPTGNSPPFDLNALSDAPAPGPIPKTQVTPTAINPTIVKTFSAANQNSNSPYTLTENWLINVTRPISPAATTHIGKGSQGNSMLAPAMASTAIV